MTPAGRPQVGTPVNTRLGDELLVRVEAVAALEGISRAEAIRRLLTVGLSTASRYGLKHAVEEATR